MSFGWSDLAIIIILLTGLAVLIYGYGDAIVGLFMLLFFGQGWH